MFLRCGTSAACAADTTTNTAATASGHFSHILKVHCERIPRSLLRGMRAKWKLCFFTSLHFEDSLQPAAGSFNTAGCARSEVLSSGNTVEPTAIVSSAPFFGFFLMALLLFAGPAAATDGIECGCART